MLVRHDESSRVKLEVCLVAFSLQIKVAGSIEQSVSFYQTTWRHTSASTVLQSHRRAKLLSHKVPLHCAGRWRPISRKCSFGVLRRVGCQVCTNYKEEPTFYTSTVNSYTLNMQPTCSFETLVPICQPKSH